MKKSPRLNTFFVALAVLLTACAPVAEPVIDPQQMLETMVAATVAALPTQTPLPTAIFSPTSTNPPPTEAFTETPLPTIPPLYTHTPTLAPASETPLASPTPAGGAEIGKRQGNENYGCVVVGQRPEDFIKVSYGQDVPVAWRIQNIGVKDWSTDSIDMAYVSGQKMSIGGSRFDLSTSVESGQMGDIIVKFEVPKNNGEYATTWGLYRGETLFCEFTFRIVVK
jgi:hypothetical protein